MKTCLFCQTSVEDNTTHCPVCGAAIPSDTAYDSPPVPVSPPSKDTPLVNPEEQGQTPTTAAVPAEDAVSNHSDFTKTSEAQQEERSDEPLPSEQSSEPLPVQSEGFPQKAQRPKRLFAAPAKTCRRILSLAIAFVVGIAAGGVIFWLSSYFSKPPAVTTADLESMAEQIAEQYTALIPEQDSKTSSIYIEDHHKPLPSSKTGNTYSYAFMMRKQGDLSKQSYGRLTGIDLNEDGVIDYLTFSFPYSNAVINESSQVFYRVFAALIRKLTPFDPNEIWTEGQNQPNWNMGGTADDSSGNTTSRSVRLASDTCYFSMHHDYAGNLDMIAELHLNPQVMFASAWMY